MKEVLTATKVVAKINQLINEGKKIKVSGYLILLIRKILSSLMKKVIVRVRLCTNSKYSIRISLCN